MKSVILLGYMCSGKTTVGKALATKLGCKFYDLDWYIELRFRKKIPEIFKEKGEEGFRVLEHKMLEEVANFENVVLACGGGTPCFYDNMELMNKCSTTIYLDASVDVLMKHIEISRVERPLLKGKTGEELRNYISEQLNQRKHYYNKAQYAIDIEFLDNFEKIDLLVNRIIDMLNLKTDNTR